MDRDGDIVQVQQESEAQAEVNLMPEQRELLRSLERSFQQAARGETRLAKEFMEEWRLEREARDNDSKNGA